jgi:cobalt/nickel transport system ATP-binding protein
LAGPLAIVIRSLSYTYPGMAQRALDEVSLEVAVGERVALVGPNGAGKSTLLLHLNGLLRGEGEVEIMGIPLNGRTVRKVRSLVGLLFQDPDDQLFSLSVLEDVAFGPLQMGLAAEQARARAMQALELVGLGPLAQRAPHQLSLGEKKRAALAALLSMDVPILALDEPTAGLDPRSRRALVGILRSLGKTMLVATHDMRLVHELCPRMVIMDGGRIVADGPTASLLAERELLERHGLEPPWVCAEEPQATHW